MPPARPLRSRRVLARSPELSRTLPSWIYRDGDLAERERDLIHGRTWTFLAHASEVTAARRIGRIEERVVALWRDDDGAPRAAVHESADASDPGRPACAEVIAGLVFVNPDPAARSLSVQAPGLAPSLRDFLPRIEELVPCHETAYDVTSN